MDVLGWEFWVASLVVAFGVGYASGRWMPLSKILAVLVAIATWVSLAWAIPFGLSIGALLLWIASDGFAFLYGWGMNELLHQRPRGSDHPNRPNRALPGPKKAQTP